MLCQAAIIMASFLFSRNLKFGEYFLLFSTFHIISYLAV